MRVEHMASHCRGVVCVRYCCRLCLPFIPYSLSVNNLRAAGLVIKNRPSYRFWTESEAELGGLSAIWLSFQALFRDRCALAAENLALRQQLAVLERRSQRPRLRKSEIVSSGHGCRSSGPVGVPFSSSFSPRP